MRTFFATLVFLASVASCQWANKGVPSSAPAPPGPPLTAPDTAVYMSPANGAPAVTMPFTFLWHTAARAAKYRLCASYNGWYSNFLDTTIAETSFTVNSVPASSTVLWNLATWNTAGWNETAWHWQWSFTVAGGVAAYSDTLTLGDKYVSPTGARANPGTYASPWDAQTALDSLGSRAGLDTILFKAGSYTVPFIITRSGTAAHPLVFSHYSTDVCSLLTATPQIRFTGSYANVQGFAARATDNASHQIIFDGSSYCMIKNCSLTARGWNGTDSPEWDTWAFHDAPYNRFLNNMCDGQESGVTSDDYRKDGIVVRGAGSVGNTIEGNTVHHISHAAIGPYAQGYVDGKNIFARNTSYCNHINIDATDRNYLQCFEGNIAYSPGQTLTYRGGVSLEASTQNSIYRFNAFYDDSLGQSMSDCPEGNSQLLTQATYAIEYTNVYYGNAFLGVSRNTKIRKCLQSVNDIDAENFGKQSFVNNIFAYPNLGYHSYCYQFQDNKPSGVTMDTVRNNLFYAHAASDTVTEITVSGVGAQRTLVATQSAYPTLWSANIEGTPKFADSTSLRGSRSFATATGSPCIDAGGALTTVAQSGFGSTIPVVNAAFFRTAWNPWDRADSVCIGGTIHDVLIAVDYGSNTLTTGSNHTVTLGQSVGILATWSVLQQTYIKRLIGTAPDIGPYER